MNKKPGWKTKSLQKQIKNHANNPKIVEKLTNRLKQLKGA